MNKRNLYTGPFSSACDQASKLGLGKNTSIVCYYDKYQVSSSFLLFKIMQHHHLFHYKITCYIAIVNYIQKVYILKLNYYSEQWALFLSLQVVSINREMIHYHFIGISDGNTGHFMTLDGKLDKKLEAFNELYLSTRNMQDWIQSFFPYFITCAIIRYFILTGELL